MAQLLAWRIASRFNYVPVLNTSYKTCFLFCQRRPLGVRKELELPLDSFHFKLSNYNVKTLGTDTSRRTWLHYGFITAA